mmetsp:Transcript_28815/g.71115  ORF Transcript_28815/g.71115 Transcript_28815/m.71115 type:complete len:272 (+) Transcript_28815:218-1033(+)
MICLPSRRRIGRKKESIKKNPQSLGESRLLEKMTMVLCLFRDHTASENSMAGGWPLGFPMSAGSPSPFPSRQSRRLRQYPMALFATPIAALVYTLGQPSVCTRLAGPCCCHGVPAARPSHGVSPSRCLSSALRSLRRFGAELFMANSSTLPSTPLYSCTYGSLCTPRDAHRSGTKSRCTRRNSTSGYSCSAIFVSLGCRLRQAKHHPAKNSTHTSRARPLRRSRLAASCRYATNSSVECTSTTFSSGLFMCHHCVTFSPLGKSTTGESMTV